MTRGAQTRPNVGRRAHKRVADAACVRRILHHGAWRTDIFSDMMGACLNIDLLSVGYRKKGRAKGACLA